MGRGLARTSHDDTLRYEWYCEDCGDSHYGANPPALCDICGCRLFDNGLDIVGEGRPLPVRTRPAILRG